MKYIIGSEDVPEKGFIYVASKEVRYYEYAINACNTLKDYHPNSHVTLFTHEKFIDDQCKVFDNVIVDIPVHYRAKMWCMARTPYQKTIYIDADSFVMHKDIRTMHDDFLSDCDMFFCPVTTYTVGNFKWAFIDKEQKIVPPYHGAICGYNKTDLTIDFQQTWFDEYIVQQSVPWPYGDKHYSEWRIFDMFTLWKITSNYYGGFDKFQDLKIKTIPMRYIITAQHMAEDKVRPVIHQIDSQTIRNIPHFQKKIDEKEKNAIYTFEKCETRKVPNLYN